MNSGKMNISNDLSVESRHRFIKQQLVALGYDQKFSIDTIPLLENVISDLLQTTDTLKHYKNLSNNCLQACHDLEQFLDAYKKDNAWLVQELNTLHLNTLSEKVTFEKRIAELEAICKSFEVTESNRVLKTRPKSCSRYVDRKTDASKVSTEYKKLKDDIRDKDIEIKQLQSEILRLNNLLSGGRPLETVLKEIPCSCDYLLNLDTNSKKNMHETVLGQYDIQHKILNSVKCYPHHRPANAENQNIYCDTQEFQTKSGINSEKLKLIEEELVNLKNKYQKLEADAKRTEKSSPEKLNKFQKEIMDLKDKCNKLEVEKIKLLKELEEMKTAYENTKTVFSKMDKELLQLRRSQQELLAEKSSKDKDIKKFQEEKKHLLNRIQELSIIEKDLTSEITRLCNVNAIHKRHILELENKLLETYQNKGKALLATFKPDIIKKPLERRVTGNVKNKENMLVSSNAAESSESAILTQIREKYKKQIENVRVDQSSEPLNIAEFQSEITSTIPKPVTFIDIRNLNEKIDTLKSILLKKDQTLANLVAENKILSNTLAELNIQNVAQNSLEEKIKRIATLEKVLMSKENKISDLEQLVDDQQKQLKTSKTESKKSTSSIDYLRNQIKTLEKCKDQTLIENRRLQRELTELQKNFSACKYEMKKAKKEATDLRVQMHDYIAKVRAAEETLQQKSKERAEMLDHFHTLTVEANHLENNNQTLETEARNAEAKIADLKNIAQNKDALIAGYEEQLNELTKTVASLETQVSNLTDQRDRLQAELDSCELFSNRSHRECTPALQTSNQKISDELLRLKTENEVLKNYLSQEKQTVSTLENILSETRNEHVGQKTSVSELHEDIRGLKATIKCLQESLETTSKQLKRTQIEADTYRNQIIQLERELRNLQFEYTRNAGDHSLN